MANQPINQLVEHKFEECSDLPRLTRIGIFSCSACDAWRERVHSRGFGKSFKRRDFMSERHQCSRPKRQMGPIRVRIICNAGCDTATDPSCSSEVGALSSFEESKENLRKASNQETRKDKRAKEVRLKLEASKRAKEVEMRLHQLNQNRESDRQLKVKQLQLDAASTTLQDITKKIGKASEMLHEYNKQVKAKKVLVQYYNKPSNDNESTSSDEVGVLCEAIESAFSFLKGKHSTTKAKLLIEAIMMGKVFKGEAANVVHDVIKQYIRNLFRPWKLVKAGDVSSVGGFKTSTIHALRNVVDENGEGFFPSPTTVNRSRALLDAYGQEMVGYYRKDTKYGEVYYINFEKAFRLLLRACELHELAQTTSVKVALTVDGADLFKGRTHVSTGIKVTDERGVHPITRQPFIVKNDDGDTTFVKVQTSEVCCVTIIADATDNKHLYEDIFKEYYQWGDKLRLEGLPESSLGPRLMPFRVTHTTDMKAAWYLSNKGGGCKNKTFFVIYVHAQKIHSPLF